jgi:hypothetical protein
MSFRACEGLGPRGVTDPSRNDVGPPVAFRNRDAVGTPDKPYFEAQYLAHAFPCQRFTPRLAAYGA